MAACMHPCKRSIRPDLCRKPRHRATPRNRRTTPHLTASWPRAPRCATEHAFESSDGRRMTLSQPCARARGDPCPRLRSISSAAHAHRPPASTQQ
eukprot:6194122-Pleurochrysis_carterae.AAC.3